MKHNAKKILSLLLSFVLVLSLLPGMTAYAADTYTLTVTYNDITIITVSNYPLGYDLYISGVALDGGFDRFYGDPTASGIVSNVGLEGDSKFIIFRVNETGSGTLSGVYCTPDGLGTPYQLNVTCVKNAPASFTVTVADTQNGTVTADKTTAAANDTITLTITPASGYQVQAITVTDVDNNPVTVTNNSFTMPAANVKVTVTFIAESVQPTTYTVTYIANNGTNEKAVEDNRAAGDYIIQAYDKNFTVPDGKVFDYWKGSDDGKYKDKQTIQLTDNLTLTAQWKEEEKKDGGEKKTGGSGSGFDLVFNIPGEDNSWGYGGGYAPQQAYRVSLAPMQGGSAALGLTTGESTETAMNVYPTTTVYVFPNAEQGYVLDKIVWSLIDGSASYDITEAKNFVMPAMDVVVYVTFKPVG